MACKKCKVVDFWEEERLAAQKSYRRNLPGKKQLKALGFEFTGVHGRGGGMGYDNWFEFHHPKHGTVCYVIHDVKTWGFTGDWYLLPPGCSEWITPPTCCPVTGESIEELEKYCNEGF